MALDYTRYFDPRLNEKQALVIAFWIAGQLRAEGKGGLWGLQFTNELLNTAFAKSARVSVLFVASGRSGVSILVYVRT